MFKSSFLLVLMVGFVWGLPTFSYNSDGLTDNSSLPFYNFHLFTTIFNKSYETPEEHQLRYSIFANNFEKIYSWNNARHNFTLSINQFTDMTQEEFTKIYDTL